MKSLCGHLGLVVMLVLAVVLAAQDRVNTASTAAVGVVAQEKVPFVCDYLGETPPGDEPQVFGRGTVSVEGKNTHALQFSPDGRTLVFSRYPDRTSYRMVGGKDGWSQPEQTSFTGNEVPFDAVSKRLLYYDRGGDLCWVRSWDDGFSTPTKLGANINTGEAEYYPSITARASLFFSRNAKWDQGRIMMATPAAKDFDTPVDLGDAVNRGGASHGFVPPTRATCCSTPHAPTAPRRTISGSVSAEEAVSGWRRSTLGRAPIATPWLCFARLSARTGSTCSAHAFRKVERASSIGSARRAFRSYAPRLTLSDNLRNVTAADALRADHAPARLS
jgi:hypothetical protein